MKKYRPIKKSRNLEEDLQQRPLLKIVNENYRDTKFNHFPDKVLRDAKLPAKINYINCGLFYLKNYATAKEAFSWALNKKTGSWYFFYTNKQTGRRRYYSYDKFHILIDNGATTERKLLRKKNPPAVILFDIKDLLFSVFNEQQLSYSDYLGSLLKHRSSNCNLQIITRKYFRTLTLHLVYFKSFNRKSFKADYTHSIDLSQYPFSDLDDYEDTNIELSSNLELMLFQ